MSSLRSQSTFIDDCLGMFDAKPDRERLGFDVYSSMMEHLKSIAGTMSDSKHHVVTGNIFTICQSNAEDLPIFDLNIFYPTLEADFTTERLDRVADIFNYFY